LDVAYARDYFEQINLRFGQDFLDLLQKKLLIISETPKLYAIVWQTVRAARLPRFTYVIYYREHPDRIEVLAVVHGSRDASSWQSRA